MWGDLNTLECLGNGGEGSSAVNRIMTTVIKLGKEMGGSKYQMNTNIMLKAMGNRWRF